MTDRITEVRILLDLIRTLWASMNLTIRFVCRLNPFIRIVRSCGSGVSFILSYWK